MIDEGLRQDVQTVSADGEPVGKLIDGVVLRHQVTQIDERGTLCEVDDGAGAFSIAGTPFRMDEGNAGPRAHLPALGADVHDVLGGLLRMSPQQIAELQQAGVVGDSRLTAAASPPGSRGTPSPAG